MEDRGGGGGPRVGVGVVSRTLLYSTLFYEVDDKSFTQVLLGTRG